MKLIGVTGKSGAGKTTFSELFSKKDNAGVIHINDLIAEVKRKYLTMLLQPEENNTTEETKKNPKLQAKVKKAFYINKLNFKITLFIRNILLEKKLENRIRELKLAGKKIILIDDMYLESNKKLFSKLDRVYAIERDFVTRRQCLKSRDDLEDEDVKIADLPYALGFFKESSGKNVKKIVNKGDIDYLRQIVDKEYEELGEQSFDERYSISEKLDTKNRIVTSIDTLSKLRNREKEKEK